MLFFKHAFFVCLFICLAKGFSSEELEAWKEEIRQQVFKDVIESDIFMGIQSKGNILDLTTQGIITDFQQQSNLIFAR